MRLSDLFRISLRALGKNKMRSGLTVLGVIIGIAAVTTMVSIGQGGSALIQKQFQNLGSNVIIVIPAMSQSGGVRQGIIPTLTPGDATAIAEECPGVKAVAPMVGASGQIIGGNVNWNPKDMSGVGPEYLVVRNWPLELGEMFTEREVAAAAKVCVIGQTLVAKLFPDVDPIGQQIRVKNIPFKVIGVLAKKGANLMGQDQDDVLIMPYTTVQKRLQSTGFSNVNVIFLSARSEERTREAEKEVTALLRERHKIAPGEPADFEVRNTLEIAQVFAAVTGSLTFMLAAIAAISLVVGGVGIMNIMLVSVTERTREIGVRMALGARPRDILRQFMVEAVVLSTIGGAFGLAIGVSASYGLTLLINFLLPGREWPFLVSIPAGIVALCFAAGVGVFFGFYPARQASKLNPIDALRYE